MEEKCERRWPANSSAITVGSHATAPTPNNHLRDDSSLKTIHCTTLTAAFLILAVATLPAPRARPDPSLTIGGQRINVEVANTPAERQKGLMYRTDLRENQGMLFIFPNQQQRRFWMKNTRIPLDIVFIDSGGEVINVEQADPEPGVPEKDLKQYRSERPAKYVLELNQGFSASHNIEKGSKVVFGGELVKCCINSS